MSSNRSRFISLEQAKKNLRDPLLNRIAIYEARLKKPFFTRGLEYLKSGYGEEGYKRSKDFLTAMEKIKTVEELIKLATEEKYHAGANMRWILCVSVLSICRFNDNHIALIRENLEKEFLATKNRYDAIALEFVTETAVFSIYEKITSSKDFGAAYLQTLNKILAPAATEDYEMQRLSH
jgi:hypothetical protein